MNGSVLDTNVITKMLDKDPGAISMVEKIENLYTSIIVVGELYFAAANSSRREANFKIFREVFSYVEIIPIDDMVCMSYAEIKFDLKKKGRPIPDNDIWIAACAHARGFSVATFDSHFSEIAQIELVMTN
jgi:tRNA(fMet)-specific endonuclease VapC